MKLLIFNAILSGYKGLVAGGLNVTLELNEMNPEDTANLLLCHRKQVKVMMQQGEIEVDELGFTEKDLEAFQKADLDEYNQRTNKSASQRLRGVLYILWGQKYETNKADSTSEQFHDYYLRKLEEIITHYKGKIEDE